MHRDETYLLDILQSAKIINDYAANKSLEDFVKDIQCQDAMIRRFELIGEAAGRVTEDKQEKHPELPWKEMKGLRNFLIHEYDDIDLEIIWKTATKDIPTLITSLDLILKG